MHTLTDCHVPYPHAPRDTWRRSPLYWVQSSSCTFIWYYPHKGHELLLYVLTEEWSSNSFTHSLVGRLYNTWYNLRKSQNVNRTPLRDMMCLPMCYIQSIISESMCMCPHLLILSAVSKCLANQNPSPKILSRQNTLTRSLSILLSPLHPALLPVTPVP